MGRAFELDRAAVYISPSGRCCRWVPSDTPPDQRTQRATFIYEVADGGGDARRDSFVLMRSNWHMLRRVA